MLQKSYISVSRTYKWVNLSTVKNNCKSNFKRWDSIPHGPLTPEDLYWLSELRSVLKSVLDRHIEAEDIQHAHINRQTSHDLKCVYMLSQVSLSGTMWKTGLLPCKAGMAQKWKKVSYQQHKQKVAFLSDYYHVWRVWIPADFKGVMMEIAAWVWILF